MGLICTKADRQTTPKVRFTNKVTPVLSSDDLRDENQRSEKGLDEDIKYFIISKEKHDFESQDILSRGDHTGPVAQVDQDTSMQDCLSREDQERITNSNANSKTDVEQHQIESCNILPDGDNRSETKPDGNSLITHGDKNIGPHNTGPDKHLKRDQDTQTNNGSISTQVASEIEYNQRDGAHPKCDDTVLGDNLYFCPLEEDGQAAQTPLKLQERLQNAPSRTPTLKLEERMLLADINRFEQLDKRREFAVRQNRSILNKLPKIKNIPEVSPENSSNSLDTTDG